MTYRFTLLAAVCLLGWAALAGAQTPDDPHDHGPADVHTTDQPADVHADERHGDDSGSALRMAGRPWWAWLVALGLVAAAALAPRALAERLPRAAGTALTATALIGAVLVLTLSRGTPVAEDEHDEHAEDGEATVAEAITLASDAEALLEIEVAPVEVSSLTGGLAATGRIVPIERNVAHLSPRVSGRVQSVSVRVGDWVAEGEVLGRLDSVDAAQAAAALRQAEAELRLAQRTLATQHELAGQGVYSRGPLEQATTAVAQARRELAGLQAEAQQARNEAETAEAELARTRRLADAGAFTTAEWETARAALATAQAALAGAREARATAQAQAAQARQAEAEARRGVADADGAVQVAGSRLSNARAQLERTEQRVASGELDRAPLDTAETALAAARADVSQAEAALELAQAQLARGEGLYRNELISLNDLQSRQAEVTRLRAERAEAAVALSNAEAALDRQRQVYEARLNSGAAAGDARAAVRQAEAELRSARASLIQQRAAVTAAEAAAARAAEAALAGGAAIEAAEAQVETAQAGLDRERALAAEGTRAGSAVDAAALRLRQAQRLAEARGREVTEAQRQVAAAQQALDRERALAAKQTRSREALLTAERAVAQADIARDNAAELLALLGASGSRRGNVLLPVRAPFAGLVTEVHLSVGETVAPEDELVTLIDLNEVYAEANVAEAGLQAITLGQTARVRVRAYPERAFEGSVVSIGGTLDPETRTAPIRVRLDNPGRLLRPEMFATLRFDTLDTAVAVVPQAAVQDLDGQPHVFVRREPGVFEPRPVVLGETDGEQVVVDRGLRPGEPVVVRNAYLLKAELARGELGHGHAH